MTALVRIKLGLVIIGLIIWTWGYLADDSFLRVVGIVVLLIAFLLRFVGRRAARAEAPKDEPPTP